MRSDDRSCAVPALELVGVAKRYVKYEDTPTLVSAALRNRSRREALWALKRVDLSVAKGECVGLVGRNGSGKSTLLRLLAGVSAPTVGRVVARGRVAPLVSVGVGFHPELTGRENVYVNATILGLSRKEIDRRLEEIVAFSEVGPFLDTPVKFYSSGMFVRLGFSVAVASDPDVLLVDEVLAVGDAGFQAKCFERMRALHEAGTTLVVVSHNLDAIRLLCPRTVVLSDGEVSYDGPTAAALDHYEDLLRAGDGTVGGRPDPTAEVLVGEVATIESLRLLGPDGHETTVLRSGDEAVFETVVRFHAEVHDPLFGIGITTPEGLLVYSDSSAFAPTGTFRPGDRALCRCRLKAVLGAGRYLASTGLRGKGLLDVYDRSAPLEFVCTEGARGLVDLSGDTRGAPVGRGRA